MGVRGLTTFIDNRSGEYLRRYALHDTYLVVDGNNIAYQLYQWHSKTNDCFGGDYDKYSKVVHDFFKLLSSCNVTPLVVFDGAYEKRKLKTVYRRMRNRVIAAQRLNSVSERTVTMFPLFVREVFVDVLLKLRVRCVRCEFEGDNDTAYLAMALKCPLLSYDSDFYIFDVLYIPFSTMELRARKDAVTRVNYVPCRMYKVENFLRSFGGLDKVHMPLLAVILGNDYISRHTFSLFYRQLKRVKCAGNELQTMIKSAIVWLKGESPDSALRKLLGRYKLNYRRRLARKIQTTINAYQCGDSQICSHFDIYENKVRNNAINVPNPEDIEESGEEELEDSSEEDPSEEDENENSPPPLKHSLLDFFRENFRKCLYPSSFMDMLVSGTYYCIPQIEDASSEHSHTISLEISAAMYKILSSPKSDRLVVVARDEHSHIRRTPIPIYEKPAPRLADIEHLDAKTRRRSFLDILNTRDDVSGDFPKSWHLFLLSLKYWVVRSKSEVELPYVYAIILCAIVISFVDSKIGFCRSTKSFLAKYGASIKKPPQVDHRPRNLTEALREIDSESCVSCMSKLIPYFQMDPKMRSNIRLYDRSIVHNLSRFQSCLLHIKHLNSLLNFPYRPLVISNLYDGTFLYNMTKNFSKRSDLAAYVDTLLGDCPKILAVFKLMIAGIEGGVLSNVRQHEAPRKKRKNRKKPGTACAPDNIIPAQEEFADYAFDKNNKYSLLAFVNK